MGVLLLVAIGAVGVLVLRRALRPPEPPTSPVVPVEMVTTYLSNLRPVETIDWPLQKSPPHGGGQGNPPPHDFYAVISVNGVRSPHGLGMHPSPRGSAAASYSLKGEYDSFLAEASINDTVQASPHPLTFSLFADGNPKPLWVSRPIRDRSETQSCNVSVKGVQVLQLKVSAPPETRGPYYATHSVWVEPRVTRPK
jgi:hypothetical protein